MLKLTRFSCREKSAFGFRSFDILCEKTRSETPILGSQDYLGSFKPFEDFLVPKRQTDWTNLFNRTGQDFQPDLVKHSACNGGKCGNEICTEECLLRIFEFRF